MKRQKYPSKTIPETPKPAELSSAKTKTFWAIIVLFPLVLIVILEIFLRLFNYGGNTDLVVKTTIQGKEYYILNREVGRRYFSQKGIAIPEAYDDYFEIKKSPNTKRVFMLGESTMEGFPYDYNATTPRLYRDRLQQLLPQYNIEVINVGLSAINSYTVLDFVKELVRYEPDAFIVYLGHNEFYGAMGIGSTEYLGQWRSVVNLYLRMRSFRTFVLMRDAVAAMKNIVSPSATPQQATLMEAMVKNKTIPYHSREYNIAMENFEANLADIASIAKGHHIPVVFSTMASNIRDQKPFISLFDEKTQPDRKATWTNNYSEGMRLLTTQRYADAMKSFHSCTQVDSGNADAFYRLGQCCDSLHQYTDAKVFYSKARDLDGLRFRAATDCSEIIRSVATRENAFLTDAEKTFEEASPHGLVGNSLMVEHLHPNIDGYFLLAKSFFQTTFDEDVLVPRSEWRLERNLSDSGFKELSGITDFDLEVGRYRTVQLTNNWPFKTASDPKAIYNIGNKVQEMAVAYVNKSRIWSQSRYELADWFKDNERYFDAEREYYAVWKIVPYYYFPLMEMGDTERLMNRSDSAETLYKRALALQRSPFVYVRLGMLYFDQNKFAESIASFESVFSALANNTETMNIREISMARFFLGAAYGQSGNIAKAKENLQTAIQIDPNNNQAKQMLSRIP
jgi:tetratricopeptide (TPR) repeat protein